MSSQIEMSEIINNGPREKEGKWKEKNDDRLEQNKWTELNIYIRKWPRCVLPIQESMEAEFLIINWSPSLPLTLFFYIIIYILALGSWLRRWALI